jgi:hypothetical protein
LTKTTYPNQQPAFRILVKEQARNIAGVARLLGVDYDHFRGACIGTVPPNATVQRLLPLLTGHLLHELFTPEALAGGEVAQKPVKPKQRPTRYQSVMSVPTFATMQRRVRAERGPVQGHQCHLCECSATRWMYLGGGEPELTDAAGHRYSADPHLWVPVCRHKHPEEASPGRQRGAAAPPPTVRPEELDAACRWLTEFVRDHATSDGQVRDHHATLAAGQAGIGRDALVLARQTLGITVHGGGVAAYWQAPAEPEAVA